MAELNKYRKYRGGALGTAFFQGETMYHVIVNPESRSGKGKNIWKELEQILQDRQVSYTAHFTKKQGDAKNFAQKLSGDVLVMGGDGTINEVLQGIRDFSKVRLSYIPLGSSNDFARDHEEKGSPGQRLVHLLTEPVKYETDLGCARVLLEDGSWHTHYFVVSAGIGYDAAVCAEVNRSKLKPVLNKIGLGKLVYLAVALRQLICTPNIPCRLTVEGGDPILMKRFLLAACMNHRFEGGGFMFAPNADAQDGFLDLCVVDHITKLKILRVLPTAYRGKHVKYKEVHMYRGQKLLIRTDTPMYVHFDGEVPGKTSWLELSCLKRALQIYL